ncbi:NAD-P-binding protein [Pilatotrama ljubarskyi]|nr:NAD-P-binding protein [Pilatotrama ljubarskyi]
MTRLVYLMAIEKPLVLVAGATGSTGRSIVKGLLDSGNFRIAALIRPQSASKPAARELSASGVEIRLGDLTDGVPKLKEALAGVDILISAARAISDQKDIMRAAKEVGVKRVVPCDFVTPGRKGVSETRDEKLAIREFIQELGVPYTFIDVGWWMQFVLPLPARSKVPEAVKEWTYALHGDGTHKTLVTDLRHIGTYVARVVVDPRTLNRAVMVWEDEKTDVEIHEIGERLSGDGEALKANRIYLSGEDLLRKAEEGKVELARDQINVYARYTVDWNEYMYSIHILGENSLENAKHLGYLDAHELYPDVPKHTLEDFAREFYAREEPGMEYLS